MKKRGFVLMDWLSLTLFVTALSLRPASAQDLCSGRCFVDPNDPYSPPYCGLSAFGHHRCIENPTYCAEFACNLPSATVSQAPEHKNDQPAVRVQVVRLKARV